MTNFTLNDLLDKAKAKGVVGFIIYDYEIYSYTDAEMMYGEWDVFHAEHTSNVAGRIDVFCNCDRCPRIVDLSVKINAIPNSVIQELCEFLDKGISNE